MRAGLREPGSLGVGQTVAVVVHGRSFHLDELFCDAKCKARRCEDRQFAQNCQCLYAFVVCEYLGLNLVVTKRP